MTSAIFKEKIFKDGKRSFIKIPFNVWQKTNQKGSIPAKVSIDGQFFECRLIPKGEGFYYIPINKTIANQVHSDEVNVSIEFIDSSKRSNEQNPYLKKRPIRSIGSIQNVTYPKAGYCGQRCLAMLTGSSVDEIIELTHLKAWQCSMSKLIEALDYFGIAHDDKVTYTKGKVFSFPECCIVNVREQPMNHLILYYKGKYYDSMDINYNQIIGYLKIHID